jgi:hypothetical protein
VASVGALDATVKSQRAIDERDRDAFAGQGDDRLQPPLGSVSEAFGAADPGGFVANG